MIHMVVILNRAAKNFMINIRTEAAHILKRKGIDALVVIG